MNATGARTIRRALAIGAVVGFVMIYLSAVGLVDRFAERPIVAGVGREGSGFLTLGLLMLATVPFLGGLNVAGAILRGRRGGRLLAIGTAGLSGLIGGVVLGAFILLASSIDLRGVFVAITPGLVGILSFDLEPILGAGLVTVLGGVFGLLGGALRVLEPRDRRAAVAALGAVVLIALLEPILDPVLNGLDLRAPRDFLFERGGLTQAAALVIIGLILAGVWAWGRPAAPVRDRIRGLPPEQRRWIGIAALAIGLLALLILPQITTGFVSLVLVNVGFYLMLALGLNIVVGYAGLLDLGYVAFFAVGAYTTGLLTSASSSIGGPTAALGGPEYAFWVALPVVMLATAFVGLLIGAPVLRLRGDYLAIVTLGFGEIARILFGSDALRQWVGGPNGIVGLPSVYVPLFGELSGPPDYFYLVVLFSALAAFVAWRLSTSRTGRAWNALREDESVAEATGVSTTNYKLLAFALGGTLGGVSGALFAAQLSTVFPGSFLLIVSITTLAIIILGGMGTIRGVIAGALILVGLPEMLREFEEYRFLVYGGALVAMMVLRPEGLFPSRIRRAELHEDVEAEARPQLPASGEAIA